MARSRHRGWFAYARPMHWLMVAPKGGNAAAVAVLAISITASTGAFACTFASEPLGVAFTTAEQVRALRRGEDTPIAAEIEITAVQPRGPIRANVVEVLWGRVDTGTLAVWPNGFGCSGAAHRVGERAFIVGRMERGADGSAYFMATRFPWNEIHTVEQVGEWSRRQVGREQKSSAPPDAGETDGMSR